MRRKLSAWAYPVTLSPQMRTKYVITHNFCKLNLVDAKTVKRGYLFIYF